MLHKSMLVLLCTGTLCFAQQTASLSREDAIRYIQSLPPGTSADVTIVEKSASGVGSGLEASGDEIVTNHKSDAPTASLDGISARGSSLDASFKVLGFQTNWLMIASVLAFIAAGVAFYLRIFRAAVVLVVLGALLLFAAFQPELAAVFLLLGIGIVVFMYLRSDKHNLGLASDSTRWKEVSRGVVAAIADFGDPKSPFYDPKFYDLVKNRVSAHTDPQDRMSITTIKTEDHL